MNAHFVLPQYKMLLEGRNGGGRSDEMRKKIKVIFREAHEQKKGDQAIFHA